MARGGWGGRSRRNRAFVWGQAPLAREAIRRAQELAEWGDPDDPEAQDDFINREPEEEEVST